MDCNRSTSIINEKDSIKNKNMKKIILLLTILIPILGFGQFVNNSPQLTQAQIDSFSRLDSSGNLKGGAINNWELPSIINPLSNQKTLTVAISKGSMTEAALTDSVVLFDPITKSYKRMLGSDLRGTQSTVTGNEIVFNNWDKNSADDFNGVYGNLTGIPLSFTPSVHNHTIADVTNLQNSIDAKLNVTDTSLYNSKSLTLAQLATKQPLGTYASGTGSATGINTGDNAANTTYANDYRAANFIAGTNYLAPNGNGSALTGLSQSQIANLSTDLASKQATLTGSETIFNGWDKDASNDFSGAFSALTGIPTTFAPATHTHTISDVTGLQSAIDAKQPNLVSATNIKTINGNSILGGGDLAISGISQTVLNDTSIAIRNNLNLKISASDTSTNYKVMTRAKTDALYVPTRSFVAGGSVNSTTTQAAMLQSDFAVIAGGRYRFKYQIRYSSAATTTGAAFALFGNADVISASIIQTNANSTTSLTQSFSGTIAAATPFLTSTSSKLTNNVAIIEGEIVANANGFFQLYFASEVAASAITILATSRKEFLRIE
jgi:hypothetical protein